jgi:hypothetical protein
MMEKNKNKKNNALYNLYNSYKLNKKGGIGKEITEEQMNYYQDYMAIKTDATQLLHEIDNIESIFLSICQELTFKIYQEKNAIINYIHDVLVPDMFDLKYEGDVLIEGPNMDKVSEFIKNNVFSEMEYKENLDIFLKITNKYNEATSDELEKYSLLFYKFYLKGGSAMKLIYNSYKEQILLYFEKDFETFLSDDEKNIFLGKNTDYDFDFLINENVEEKHYNELVVITSKIMSEFLYEIIIKNSENFFNNHEFINYFMKKLKNNKPFPLNPKLKLTYIVNSKIEDENIYIENDSKINKIGIIKCDKINFENPFSKKGKESIKFYLIRLMLKFKNNILLRDGDYNNIYAEIIDIVVPIYSSYDKKTKWNKTISNIKINGIYCYNLNAIINDIENIISETEETNDPIKITKLNKRINRLVFFKNLICIIPRLIYQNEINLPKKTGIGIDQYKYICEEIINKICPFKMIGKLRNTLNNILGGIYLNFPETINPNNLDIFSILKQYFRYVLIDNIENQNNFHNKIFETSNLELLKMSSFSDDGKNIMMDNIYFSGYFTIFEEYEPSIYKYSKINFRLFQHISTIIDNFKNNFDEINSEKIKKLLCILFLSYSKFIMYFNNNSLYNDSLLLFFNILTNIYNAAIENPTLSITQQSIELSIITDRYLLQTILNDTKEMNKSIMNKIQYPLIKLSLYIKEIINNSKLYLRGSYAYNIHRILRNNYDDNDLYFNDIDMYIIINDENENENEFMEKSSLICNMYDEYFKDYFMNNKQYLMNDENELFSIDSHVFKESNSILYQILLNRYIPLSEVNNVNLNIIFNDTFNKIDIDEETKKNKYRIISYHIFEMHITNEVYDTFSTIDEILLDPYLKNNYEENKIKFENYLNFIKTNNNTKYENENIINENDINFNNFYIQNIENLLYDYDNIISNDNDILIKNVYVERLLNLSTI